MTFPTFDELADINYTDSRWYELDNLPNEEWRDIQGYEGNYMVSNYGRVKSLPRKTAHIRILKPRLDKGGYLYLGLTKDGKPKTYKVHRLVGNAFIPNPENKYSINHIDGKKINNMVFNLEWATRKEQARHAVDTGLWKWTEESKAKLRKTQIERGIININKIKKNPNKRTYGGCVTRPIVQKDDNGNIIKIWVSMSDASRVLNIPVPHLVRVCKGLRKHSRGFVWEYYKGDKFK